MEAHPPYAEFPVLYSGVDWLTCTSKRRGVSNELEDFGMRELLKVKAADGQISAAKRLGFTGHSAGHVFLGVRPGDVMIQLSGSACTPLAAEAITLSSNVSRIDLQTTIWTEGEACDLAGWTDRVMRQRRETSGEHGALDLITNWPAGGTLNINRRVSSGFGRLYDKTVEAKLGPPRLVWRYEIELKGTTARQVAKRLAECGVRPQHVNKLVHAWYTKRGVRPAFASGSGDLIAQPLEGPPKRDVLTWMRRSLSKTVSAAMAKHGRRVVIEALGLSHMLQPEEVKNHGVFPAIRNAISFNTSVQHPQPTVPEWILFHQQGSNVR